MKKDVSPRQMRNRMEELDRIIAITGLSDEEIARRWIRRRKLWADLKEKITPLQALCKLVTWGILDKSVRSCIKGLSRKDNYNRVFPTGGACNKFVKPNFILVWAVIKFEGTSEGSVSGWCPSGGSDVTYKAVKYDTGDHNYISMTGKGRQYIKSQNGLFSLEKKQTCIINVNIRSSTPNCKVQILFMK